MHGLNIVTICLVATLVGVEFSVSAFVNPAAWRLDPEPQLKMLGRLAFILGKVMPVWYPACAVLLGVETWLRWHGPEIRALLAADGIWLLASLASISFLVPLNDCVAQGEADWQRIHRVWDKRNWVRIAALAMAAVLLADAVVR